MTPTELDAIFRAWRDDMQAGWPRASGWSGRIEELRCYLYDRLKNWDDGEAVIKRALEVGDVRWTTPRFLVVDFPPAPEPPLSFADPPPLPANAPIPFPAGKALMEEVKSIPYPYSDGSIVMRWVCVHHFPRWFDECPACKITASSR